MLPNIKTSVETSSTGRLPTMLLIGTHMMFEIPNISTLNCPWLLLQVLVTTFAFTYRYQFRQLSEACRYGWVDCVDHNRQCWCNNGRSKIRSEGVEGQRRENGISPDIAPVERISRAFCRRRNQSNVVFRVLPVAAGGTTELMFCVGFSIRTRASSTV